MTDPDDADRPVAFPVAGSTTPGTFEDRLLEELRSLVAQREIVPTEPIPQRLPRRRRTIVAAATLAAVVAVAAVVIPTVLLGHHGARSAYAVQREDNGKVSLQVRGAIAEPAAMQHDLELAGAPIKVLAGHLGARCRAPRTVRPPAGLLSHTDAKTFVIDPRKIPRGTVLVAQVPVRGHGGPLRLSLSRSIPHC